MPVRTQRAGILEQFSSVTYSLLGTSRASTISIILLFLTFELMAQTMTEAGVPGEIKLFQDRVFCHELTIPRVSQSP